MKNVAWLIVLLALNSFCFGQSREFIKKAQIALEAKDASDSIVEKEHSDDEYDFMSDGTGPLELQFLSEFMNTSRNKPDVLQTSLTLMTLAEIATEAWKGSQYANHKKWNKLNRYFRRASNESTGRFNILKAISFRIPLVNHEGKSFYHDSKGAKGELNLYQGSQPKTKVGLEEIEKVPLKYYTETELVNKCMHQLRKRRLYSDLKKGYYSYAGVKVVVDEKSLFKNKIPTARVVIVLGARRMRTVRVKSST